MDHSTSAFFVLALCLLAIAAGLNAARRELAKKRRQHRMAQALRQGLLRAEGIPPRNRTRLVRWQAGETA
jgi:hypothetical protein